MRITDLLSASSIDLNAKPLNKKEAIEQAVKLMAASGNITDIEAYTKQVIAREEESTTGVGEGIAIPHGKCSAVSRPGLAAMIIRDGVDYDSLDGEPVNVLFLIAAPDSEDNVHLDVLSKLSVLLMDEEFIRKLKAAKDIGEFLEVIDNADSESKSIDERLQDTGTYNAGNSDTNPADRYIVAVTSCPTGIAHTYMAAEGLEKAAKKAGCTIKIETRGSAGAKNVLTDEDIEKAECIIVAADAKVPMARFEGHKVIECQVSDGINKADELISQALSGDVPEYQVSFKSTSSKDFLPRFLTLIISSGVLLQSSSTVLIPALLRQLDERTDNSRSSILIERTLVDSSTCCSTIISALAAFSERLMKPLRCSLRTLAARLNASSGAIVPLVNISSVSLSKSVS